MQRLHITRPIDAWFGDFSVRLLDVTAARAVMEHDEQIPDRARALLRFFWREHELEIPAETAIDQTGSELRFTEQSDLLARLIADSAEEVLRAQQANAEGQRDANVVGDETLTAASAGLRARGYVTWTLEEDGWKKRPSLLPDQPPNGFTVAAGEPSEQVEMLRQTWENGDEETRRMTRSLAELSATSVKAKDR